MKRYNNIFDKITDLDNIKCAINNASKGKMKRRNVKRVVENTEMYAIEIRRLLISKEYKPLQSKGIVIYDKGNRKYRKIYKPAFYPDQIVQWAITQVIQPILMNGMYAHNCGSIPKRGSGHGQKMIRKWLGDVKNTKYALKMDVEKFYPSIDKAQMLVCFEKKFKDKAFLELISLVIEASDEGLPIGNYTSQWFANFFLTELDHKIKHEFKAVYYVRYIDDMVILGPNKRKLHKIRIAIERELNKKGLKLKKNWQVFRVDDRGIDFLGFRFFRNKTILRKRNALKIRRKARRIDKKGCTIRHAQSLMSYWGWIKRSNSYNFYVDVVKPIVPIKKVRMIIGEDAKSKHA